MNTKKSMISIITMKESQKKTEINSSSFQTLNNKKPILRLITYLTFRKKSVLYKQNLFSKKEGFKNEKT